VTSSRRCPKPPPGDSYWSSYLSPPPDMTRYRRGAIVLDVGCGNGAQLARLREAGHRAIGVEVDPEAARACQRSGHAVVIASLENLPFRSSSCPGILCKVVIPYTDEQLAIAEIGRVLAPGGVALLYLHGLGYSLRYLLKPDIWKRSVRYTRPRPSSIRWCTASWEGVFRAVLVTLCSNPRRAYAAAIAQPALRSSRLSRPEDLSVDRSSSAMWYGSS